MVDPSGSGVEQGQAPGSYIRPASGRRMGNGPGTHARTAPNGPAKSSSPPEQRTSQTGQETSAAAHSAAGFSLVRKIACNLALPLVLRRCPSTATCRRSRMLLDDSSSHTHTRLRTAWPARMQLSRACSHTQQGQRFGHAHVAKCLGAYVNAALRALAALAGGFDD